MHKFLKQFAYKIHSWICSELHLNTTSHSSVIGLCCLQHHRDVVWECLAFSALTLLVGQQEGHPACKKTEQWGAGVVIWLERGADLHMAQLMQLPLTVSCFSKIQIGFTFLVPAHPGSPGQRAIKQLGACVCVRACMLFESGSSVLNAVWTGGRETGPSSVSGWREPE